MYPEGILICNYIRFIQLQDLKKKVFLLWFCFKLPSIIYFFLSLLNFR